MKQEWPEADTTIGGNKAESVALLGDGSSVEATYFKRSGQIFLLALQNSQIHGPKRGVYRLLESTFKFTSHDR